MQILISDDNYDFTSTIAEIVQNFGYETHAVYTPEDTIQYLDKFGKKISALLLDIEFGPDTNMNGIDVLEYARRNHPFVPVIMITGKGTIETAVKATKLGAVNFIEKSIVSAEKLREVLDSAISSLGQKDKSEILNFLRTNGIIGSSEKILEMGYSIIRFGRTDLNVLIYGETGTGKKLVAQAIHNASRRIRKPFVVVDIPNIPRELFQSELFGHVKGAFTGASMNKEGLFQKANGGTLFLDEIGELSLELQASLLNPIEEKIIRKIGSSENEEIDVRIISATDKDLSTNVSQGSFRSQLYHRLRECEIQVPPLRERREDIPEIVQHYLAKYNIETGQSKFFSPSAIEFLQEQEWYGNVRELINTIRIARESTEKETIEIPDLKKVLGKRIDNENGDINKEPKPNITTSGGIKEDIERVEKMKIERVLEICRGNVSKAAATLGISRETLHNKIRKYKINPSIYRNRE
ncbi:MAG: sigma-54 dependent transcriptional regulator [Ignavibacteria bacterium]|nr:sigma-54 dependent transcriptional regulator [Ignavibacteria bacterium]